MNGAVTHIPFYQKQKGMHDIALGLAFTSAISLMALPIIYREWGWCHAAATGAVGLVEGYSAFRIRTATYLNDPAIRSEIEQEIKRDFRFGGFPEVRRNHGNHLGHFRPYLRKRLGSEVGGGITFLCRHGTEACAWLSDEDRLALKEAVWGRGSLEKRYQRVSGYREALGFTEEELRELVNRLDFATLFEARDLSVRIGDWHRERLGRIEQELLRIQETGTLDQLLGNHREELEAFWDDSWQGWCEKQIETWPFGKIPNEMGWALEARLISLECLPIWNGLIDRMVAGEDPLIRLPEPFIAPYQDWLQALREAGRPRDRVIAEATATFEAAKERAWEPGQYRNAERKLQQANARLELHQMGQFPVHWRRVHTITCELERMGLDGNRDEWERLNRELTLIRLLGLDNIIAQCVQFADIRARRTSIPDEAQLTKAVQTAEEELRALEEAAKAAAAAAAAVRDRAIEEARAEFAPKREQALATLRAALEPLRKS